MNNNDINSLAKKTNRVIENLTNDLNGRFKIYNELIVELDARLVEQENRIKELEKIMDEFSEVIEGIEYE